MGSLPTSPRQKLLSTLCGSPLFDVKDMLTGDAARGAAYSRGEGKCVTCHSATGDLGGIGTRLTPVNPSGRESLQLRLGDEAGVVAAIRPQSWVLG